MIHGEFSSMAPDSAIRNLADEGLRITEILVNDPTDDTKVHYVRL